MDGAAPPSNEKGVGMSHIEANILRSARILIDRADLIVELSKKLAQADADIAHWMVQALEIRQSRDAMEKQLVLAGLLSKPSSPSQDFDAIVQAVGDRP